MTTKSLADRMFDASHAVAEAEDAFFTELERIVGDGDWWQDFGYDYYDRSFELHGVTVGHDLTDEQLTAFGANGFVHCWLNYTDGTERHYGFSPPGRGSVRPGRTSRQSLRAIEDVLDQWERHGDQQARATLRARRALAAIRSIVWETKP